MGELLSAFGNAAQNLSRNPLGIIALFIVLVYGFAALVVGPFGAHLSEAQKWLLIIFLVAFPVLVLLLFTYLVVGHHAKLYAPSDYRSDEAFARTLSPKEQGQRIDRELSASFEEPGNEPNKDTQRRSLNTKQQYLLAEDLALRKIEAETNQPIKRQVEFRTRNQRLVFDGAIFKSNEFTFIEVKYIARSSPVANVLRKTVSRAGELTKHLLLSSNRSLTLRLLVVIVTQAHRDDLESLIEDQLRLEKHDSKVSLEVRQFDLDELKDEFGIG